MVFSVSIELVSSSARVTSVKSTQVVDSLTDGRTTGPNYRTPGLPGSDKKVVSGVSPRRVQGIGKYTNFFDGFLKKRVNVCRDKIRQNNA